VRRLLCVLVLLAAAAAPAGAYAAADPLTVKGGRLVDAQGRAVVLHGVITLRWTAVLGADTVVAVPRLAYPRGFDVHTVGARVVRRSPLTLRGVGRASITLTRR
jgi:hypothetical protein